MSEPTHRINYVELFTHDLDATVDFYAAAFGWSFERWGDQYVSFSDACGIEGGFDLDPERAGVRGAVVILWADDLDGALASVLAAGASVTVPTFSFPGGRRFQFADPSGNELAVWSTPSPE